FSCPPTRRHGAPAARSADRWSAVRPTVTPIPRPHPPYETPMNKLAFTLATALLLTACATTTSPSLPLDTAYKVEWIGERPLIDRSHVTITLGTDGRAHGHAGCNRWFASYAMKGDQLNFSQ